MNPLALYLLVSLAGIAVLVGVNALLFGRRGRGLDMAALEARLGLDEPGFRAGNKVLAGAAALIENAADGALYVARANGEGFVVRKLGRGTLKRLARDGAALDLRLADFAFPRARLAFAGDAEASAWEARLKDFAG
ncbi:MAG TPA: hypothetical protein VMH86_05155 [Rhizomicrobium sp.]|nr:hypothetical protein [Rhizomicrobium sp.]